MDIESKPGVDKAATMRDHPATKMAEDRGYHTEGDEAFSATASNNIDSTGHANSSSAASSSPRISASLPPPSSVGSFREDTPTSSSSTGSPSPSSGIFADPLVRVFAVLMLAQVVLFAEAGAVPALLVQLTSAFKLTFPEQGYLGGIVYFGIAVGAPITSEFFKCANPKHVLFWTLLINIGALLVFASVPAGWTQTLISTRFLIGFTQATFSVYVPVWVDRFAPKDRATQWFSWLQITVPVGIMIGYMFGWIAIGLQTAPNNGGQCFGGALGCWRLPFFFQVIITLPVCCAVMSLPREQLDVEAVHRRREAAAVSDATPFFQSVRNYCRDVMTILRSFYFTMCVIVITCMYFVLMSIQYWGTDFMIQARSYSEHTTMLLFVLVTATAPVVGAILGGVLVDKLGGFEGDVVQRSKCTGAIFIFNFVGTVFALLTTYFPNLGISFVAMCLWFVLFFGGMSVPALTGMYTAAIPEPRLKILGSSIMLVVTSVGSYCLSPILAGYLMSRLSKEIPECKSFVPGTCPQALEQGFRWSLFMGIVAVFFMGVLWVGGCFVEGTLAGDVKDSGRKVDSVEERNPLLGRETGEGGRSGYGGTSAGAAASIFADESV